MFAKAHMKKIILPALTLLVAIIFSARASAQSQETYTYKPESQDLYNTIVHMDSVYFNAYNTSDMKTQAAVFADSIEFYHDKGGLMTSKQAILDAIKNNICGKVTRVLVKGSIEVYPIAGYGAVEIALHRFVNHAESESPSKPDKFIVIWHQTSAGWKITRVVSLH